MVDLVRKVTTAVDPVGKAIVVMNPVVAATKKGWAVGRVQPAGQEPAPGLTRGFDTGDGRGLKVGADGHRRGQGVGS